MIRLSKKGDYAVFLMGHLVQRGACPSSDGPAAEDVPVVSAQEIAEQTGMPKSIAANLLKELTRAGLLASVRGIHGGYRLALPPERISVGAILEVVEGPLLLVDCAQDLGSAPIEATEPDHLCRLSSFCPSRSYMRILHERIARLMHEMKLPELLSAGTLERVHPVFASFAPAPSAGGGNHLPNPQTPGTLP